MRIQDEMRLWIRAKLDERGRGARKKFADFLGLTPNQVTRMLNTEKGKEIRAIKAHEWVNIERFFADGETVKKFAEMPSVRSSLSEIYDSLKPERQKMLLEFAEFLVRRPK